MKTLEKVRAFTELTVWQKGHALVLQVYAVTKAFPREEIFGITNQMRRCSVSITSNIAEGFSRRTTKDKSHFYIMALGSTTELQNQLLVCRDVRYVSQEIFDQLFAQTDEVKMMLHAMIRKTPSLLSVI